MEDHHHPLAVVSQEDQVVLEEDLAEEDHPLETKQEDQAVLEVDLVVVVGDHHLLALVVVGDHYLLALVVEEDRPLVAVHLEDQVVLEAD